MRKVFVVTMMAVLAAAPLSAADDYVERMSREHAADKPLSSPAARTPPAGEIAEEEVEYAALDAGKIKGFLAYPKGAAEAPGIIVIHEWWGLNDNIRAMARRLAGEGYQALAVDLYEGRTAERREDASALMKEAMGSSGRLEENLKQAYAFLEEERKAPRVGVIGWCFGGGWSLQTALLLPDAIDATVIYYGRLVTDPGVLEALNMPILGIFGSLDQGIPVESVRKFEEALRSLGKDAVIHVYEGAGHAFANPSGTRYQEDAALDAWEKTAAFFARNLREGP